MLVRTLSIVGVGLIGGSIGLAARAANSVERIIGVGRQAESLRTAHRLGIIDSFTTDLIEGVREADLVVFCTPVDRIPAQIQTVAPHCRPGTILTDAGSTKEHIVAAVEKLQLPRGVHFVGSHPLAGSEKRGPEAAKADLFEKRLVVLTPTPRTDRQALERTAQFWQALGARTTTIDPATHDRALAFTSHLPHAVAAALAIALPPDWQQFCATGFRDTTRVASGDAELWTAIFRDNRIAVLDALDRMTAYLIEFRSILQHDHIESLLSFLIRAKENRDALGT